MGIKKILFLAAVAIIALTLALNSKPHERIWVEALYGDSLWEIAERYKPDDVSMKSYWNTIIRINDGMDYNNIKPGQKVLVEVAR